MTSHVAAALDMIKRIGMVLFGLGTALFLVWLVLYTVSVNSRIRMTFLPALEIVGFFYFLAAIPFGLIVAGGIQAALSFGGPLAIR